MLNKFIKLVFCVLIFIIGCAGKFDWIDTLPKPWQLNEEEVSELLSKFKEKYPNFEDRLKALTLWRIGTPYEEFKLGEEILPDTDPLFRLDVSDCTVHVLTTFVLAQSSNWNDARENITEVHYKLNSDGEHIPSYDSRWHFTSDRLLSNPSTVDITNKIADDKYLKNVELILNKKQNGSPLLDMDWSKKIQLSYIPNKFISLDLLDKLPQICGIAFVREAYIKNGLIIAHEGILLDKINLVHASSDSGQTAKVNFMEYYFNGKKPNFDGIMVYKFVPF